jgi:hypothetical protein
MMRAEDLESLAEMAAYAEAAGQNSAQVEQWAEYRIAKLIGFDAPVLRANMLEVFKHRVEYMKIRPK